MFQLILGRRFQKFDSLSVVLKPGALLFQNELPTQLRKT